VSRQKLSGKKDDHSKEVSLLFACGVSFFGWVVVVFVSFFFFVGVLWGCGIRTVARMSCPQSSVQVMILKI